MNRTQKNDIKYLNFKNNKKNAIWTTQRKKVIIWLFVKCYDKLKCLSVLT